ncbi:hypothetical protein ENUP19_0046G0062 [Entamoeba nuttalli]|uniref:UBA/TS-N domain containing protein n=2 Tax=Entamoeba nuttalli TaxID=412467 RepID=K2H9M5_ENTNP|nr:UBA/TS-N domain containing protein [Entamoeba nuttalli P19]EKE39299.1 UBA/TS-N domain containing protein [Entamoeba nuttalli P19]|eukprot:XP_008858366.1 UBA/TS-N domain containing protein [Entamoeba nuttalli P19]
MSIGFPIIVQYFNGTQKELKEVINKYSPDVGIIKLTQQGPNSFKVIVNNTQQGRTMMNFNNFIYNGNQMIVTFEREPSTEAQLLHCFEVIKYSFCDVQQRRLDLSNLMEKFKQLGYSPQQTINQIFTQCIHYFKEEIPDLLELSIASNQIGENTKIFSEISYGFPLLSKIDISNNNLTALYQIQALENLPIREMNLLNNPLLKPTIIPQLTIYFSSLEILNGQQIKQRLYLPSVNSIPLPSKFDSIYPSNPEHFKQIFQFMKTYFHYHDTDVQQLVAVYSQQSIFDIVLEKGIKFPSTTSRNLKSITNSNDILKSVCIGQRKIAEKILNLGGTTHRATCFCYDIISINSLVNINVMGDVKIGNDVYQFCRTFVLILSPNPIILNDHLHLFSNTSVFTTVKTYSSYVRYISSHFPGLDEEYSLFTLEKNQWNVPQTQKEICQHFNIKSTF